VHHAARFVQRGAQRRVLARRVPRAPEMVAFDRSGSDRRMRAAARTPRLRQICALLAACAGLFDTATARAEPSGSDDHRLHWNYPRFHTLEYIATGTISGVVLWTEHDLRGNPDNGWTNGILLDEPTLDLLFVDHLESRKRLDTAARVLWNIAHFSAIADSILTPLISDGFNLDVAAQMTLINLEVEATTVLLTRLTTQLVGRSRPIRSICEEDPNADPVCQTDYDGRDNSYMFASFFSGHVSTSFAGASAFCAHHTAMPLYGGGAADDVACAAVLAAATFVGIERMMVADHWWSDVTIGAAVGSLTGWGMPYLLHYAWPGRFETDVGVVTVLPQAHPDGGGVALSWQ
jgi:membrane-associated phospholipid phosphatase